MSLYERMYDAATEADGYIEIAAATEVVADDNAVCFLIWIFENHEVPEYADLSAEELYQQYKMSQ